jgi:hypothetical protein
VCIPRLTWVYQNGVWRGSVCVGEFIYKLLRIVALEYLVHVLYFSMVMPHVKGNKLTARDHSHRKVAQGVSRANWVWYAVSITVNVSAICATTVLAPLWWKDAGMCFWPIER